MRNLVKRYVAAMIRDAKTEEGLTEENFKVCVYFYVYSYFICFNNLVKYFKTVKHISHTQLFR